MLLMGPDKLPEVAQKIGAGWRALKNIQQRIESEVREALPDLPSTGDIARIARSPVNLLNQLAERVDAKEATSANDARSSSTDASTSADPATYSSSWHAPPSPPSRSEDVAPPDPSLN